MVALPERNGFSNNEHGKECSIRTEVALSTAIDLNRDNRPAPFSKQEKLMGKFDYEEGVECR